MYMHLTALIHFNYPPRITYYIDNFYIDTKSLVLAYVIPERDDELENIEMLSTGEIS